MSLVALCPSCQSRYKLKDELAGKKFKCKKCGQVVQAPGSVPAASGAAPRSASSKAAAAPGKSGHGQDSPAAMPVLSPSRAESLSSFLDEELAAAAAPPAIPDIFDTDSHDGQSSRAPTVSPEQATKKCPHCKAEVDVTVIYCTECGLAVHKKYSGVDDKHEHADSKEWLFVLGGIGAAMVTTPLLFLLLTLMMGGVMAMLVCAIEMNMIVSMGSFALACRIFKQEPPEPSDILRIVGWSVVPANFVVMYFGGTGLLAALAGVATAAVISALLCMFQVQMPVVPSILVSISYNIFAGILTIIGIIVMTAIFAGYLVATGLPAGPGGGRSIQQINPLETPTDSESSPSPDAAEEPDDNHQSSLDRSEKARDYWMVAETQRSSSTGRASRRNSLVGMATVSQRGEMRWQPAA